MRIERATTQQWPDFTQPTGTFQPSTGDAFPPSKGAFQPSTSATSAPASTVAADPTVAATARTMVAAESDGHDKAPASPPSATASKAADTAMAVPLRVPFVAFLLVAGALAIAGIFLRAIFKIARTAWGREDVTDQDGDLRIGGHEPIPPPFARAFVPPQLPIEQIDANRDFQETLREMWEAWERRAA
jgi:hypothetical protein